MKRLPRCTPPPVGCEPLHPQPMRKVVRSYFSARAPHHVAPPKKNIQHRFEDQVELSRSTLLEVGLNRAPARLDAEREGAAQGGRASRPRFPLGATQYSTFDCKPNRLKRNATHEQHRWVRRGEKTIGIGAELERERLTRLRYGDDCGEGKRATI